MSPNLQLLKLTLLICLSQAHGFQLNITSLPNSSCLYNINITEGAVTLFGDQHSSCDINIEPSHTIKTLISPISGSKIATGTEYIYLERLGSLDICSNQYVAFKHPLQTCNFWHSAIQLHFRGNVNISIHETETMKADGSIKCLEDINQEDVGCEIKGYESVIQCVSKGKYKYDFLSGPITICNMQCPDNCSCILNDREVMYSCSIGNDQSINRSVFLLFPSNFSILDMSENGLTAVKSDSFSTIGKFIIALNLSSNSLVSLPEGLFHGLYKLIDLWLDHNSLVSLPAGLFDGLPDLIILELAYNSLASLPAGLFRELRKLIDLWLFHNSLESLQAGVFYGLPDLEQLRLEYNFLMLLPAELFHGLHKLTKLWLDHNFLVSLPPGLFCELHKLTDLLLGHNSLVSLPAGLFHGLNKLTNLYLDHNSLESLPAGIFHDLPDLIQLTLDYNSLVSLPGGLFHGLYTLQYLFLNDNFLASLPAELFHDLYELNLLRLDNNLLVSLPASLFLALHNLQRLAILNNNITQIAHNTFSNLTSLKEFYLGNNHVTFLPFNLFDELANIDILDLSNNRLTHIPRLGHMTKLKAINLVGNKLTGITQEIFDGVAEDCTIAVDQPVVCVCYMNKSESCFHTKKPSPYLTCGWLLSLPVLSFFTWILGLCATLGNGFVLFWRQLNQRGHENKVQSVLLINLAMSDLLMGIYMIIIASADVYYGEYFPMNAENWRSGRMCKFAGSLAIMSSEASVFLVTFISVDRFINIKFPYTIHKLSIKSTRWISFVVWSISLTLGLTASILAGRNPKFYDNSHVCIGLPLAQMVSVQTNTTLTRIRDLSKHDIQYVPFNVVTDEQQSPGLYFSVALFIGLNMFCFLLILACYIAIIKTVSQTSKQASRKREMAEEIRMTIKVSAIVLTDFCCWFPICLIGALVQAEVVAIPPDTFAWVVTFVLPINSAINPFMYTIGTVIGDKCTRKQSYAHQVQMQTLSTSSSPDDK